MRYQKWGRNKVKIYCYSQQSSKKYLIKDSSCDNVKADSAQVESIVLADLFRRTDSISAEGAVSEITASAERVLKQRYDEAAAKLKRLYNLYAASGDELLLETIEENKAALASLRKQLEEESASRSTSRELTRRLLKVSNLRSQWDSLSMKERQQAVNTCIEKIVIDGSDIDVFYRF